MVCFCRFLSLYIPTAVSSNLSFAISGNAFSAGSSMAIEVV